MKQIAEAERRRWREKVTELRAAISSARLEHRGALRAARHRCRADRAIVRVRVREMRVAALAMLKQAAKDERAGAKARCAEGLAQAKAIGDRGKRARAEVHAERTYRAELRRIERANRARFAEHKKTTARVRRGESDDEVRGNIPPEYLGLWERVKARIRGTDRMTRSEAFLRYAEEHPAEVLEGIEDRTDAMIRELEEKERRAHREMKRARPRPVEEVFADVTPF